MRCVPSLALGRGGGAAYEKSLQRTPAADARAVTPRQRGAVGDEPGKDAAEQQKPAQHPRAVEETDAEARVVFLFFFFLLLGGYADGFALAEF
jgi:hypothetical protein